MSELDCVAVGEIPNTKNINELLKSFSKRFENKPDFVVRVPGRVNLIGEHIDYCGYGVCPMALAQTIIIAVGIIPSSTQLTIANIDPKYSEYKCDIKNYSIELEIGKTLWYNYVLCGIQGIKEILSEDQLNYGLNIIISGNIPPGSGLSSSSALVSASVTAMAYASKLNLTKQKLADISASCERYIGTQGGGMDQAIAFLANEGCAKYIEFNPLRSTTVTLPSDAIFVISHSLARLNKAATADFNCRVMECKLSAKLLAKMNNIDWKDITRLKDVQTKLKVDLPTMIQMVNDNFHIAPYTREELSQLLDLSNEQFEEILSYNTKDMNMFKLKQRALHVFQEALRVERFVDICEEAQRSNANDELTKFCTLEKLGQLLLESHESLRRQYECSHINLDKIVELSKEGTFGARLTGAGWGGCAVALVKPDSIDKYISVLKREFYQSGELGGDDIDALVFATFPQGGACIYKC